ncbi:hypothetical protein AQUCO_00200648v1 [Aquilegia coerulea]|uniref:cAMP-regulated phosphoprotein 19-related protein n=1 Tax=Aquilegia coerulea TaxID=218851 RepID=A0A2G5F447_AQUCA|nr:hypothetical protein AQUCO_00200648v1 [Aquilegia coerulea]
MSGTNVEDVKEQELAEHNLEVQVDGEFPGDDTEHIEKKEENVMPSAQEEEAIIKKKYGGMLPRKPPLISKDHERAFFDSADWALGKEHQYRSPRDHLKHFGQNCSPHHIIKHDPGDQHTLLQTMKMMVEITTMTVQRVRAATRYFW